MDFTKEELELLSEMISALTDGFEYFTEDNKEVFESISCKIFNAIGQ